MEEPHLPLPLPGNYAQSQEGILLLSGLNGKELRVCGFEFLTTTFKAWLHLSYGFSSTHHYLILPEEPTWLYDACISVMCAEAPRQQATSFSETSLLRPLSRVVPRNRPLHPFGHKRQMEICGWE